MVPPSGHINQLSVSLVWPVYHARSPFLNSHLDPIVRPWIGGGGGGGGPDGEYWIQALPMLHGSVTKKSIFAMSVLRKGHVM